MNDLLQQALHSPTFWTAFGSIATLMGVVVALLLHLSATKKRKKSPTPLIEPRKIAPRKSSETTASKIEVAAEARKLAEDRSQPLTHETISIARLPTSGPDLFGRERELKILDDAWADPNTNIVSLVAWGGVGKTALINHWLKKRMARDNYRGAQRVYGWSFFSQGTSDRAASADLFIDQALRWFGDADPTAGSPWDKGERLAGYLRQTRTLLILDGLEPLQHPPGSQEGRLKDAAMQALLVELAAHQPGLCVISTRERIGDLIEFEDSTVLKHDLDYLSPQAGAEILRSLNVKGDNEELEQASREMGGHAFSLTLLGSYLDEVLERDIRRRKEIENLFEDTRYGEKAQVMIAAYEKWLGGGMELSILRLLGFFDRSADAASIAALRERPAIPGLTESLQHFEAREWSQAVAKLRRIKLLAEASQTEPGTLDAHPLLREHFKQQLKRKLPDAWREGNNRLYEYLKKSTKKLPGTLDEMAPLYATVAHGCAAGNHQDALDQIYWQRIQRGNEFFNLRKLGAFGADLAVLSGFFEGSWDRLATTVLWEPFVFNQAGVGLRAVGRLREAAKPLKAAVEAYMANKTWSGASISANNLSELYATIGDLSEALKNARHCVELADRSGDVIEQLGQRATLADILNKMGKAEEAAVVFKEAEDFLIKAQPNSPFLFSFSGFRYCDLLLDYGEFEQVKARATNALEIARKNELPMDIAWGNLSLGRALLLEAKQTTADDTTEADGPFDEAIICLRKSGSLEFIPLGLLARAELHRFKRNYELSRHDLVEAYRIATRSEMGLHLADYHLESARLRLAQGDKDDAREHTATAKEMIERMGYHRRDKEVKELEERLAR